MNTINIKSIDLDNEKLCYHFSLKKNNESIEKNGLEPRIGENSKTGFETQKRIYFSKTTNGAVCIVQKIIDNCISYINNGQKENDAYREILKKYNKPIDLEDENSVKQAAFFLTREMLKMSNYYLLDLHSSKRSDYENMSDDEKLKVDYIEDDCYEDGSKIADSNRHTIENRSIESDKISKIIDDNKEIDGFDIAMKLIEHEKQKGTLPLGTYYSPALRKNTIIDLNQNYQKVDGSDDVFITDKNIMFKVIDGNVAICGKKENMLDEFYEFGKNRVNIDHNLE